MSIVLYGCGSSIVVDVEESCLRLGLVVAAAVQNTEARYLGGAPCIAATEIPDALRSLPFAVPIFAPGHRLRAREDAMQRGFTRVATIVDPTATVAGSSTIEAGSYVNAGAIIGGAAKLGAFVFINRGATVGHHSELLDFVSVGPRATICGMVRLGRGAVVSAGAIILPDVEIGANAIVGAGAVVTKPIPPHCLAYGNPARVVKTDIAGYRDLSV
jgi:hypothetical protein